MEQMPIGSVTHGQYKLKQALSLSKPSLFFFFSSVVLKETHVTSLHLPPRDALRLR